MTGVHHHIWLPNALLSGILCDYAPSSWQDNLSLLLISEADKSPSSKPTQHFRIGQCFVSLGSIFPDLWVINQVSTIWALLLVDSYHSGELRSVHSQLSTEQLGLIHAPFPSQSTFWIPQL